ncbi:hypothetical protein L6164_028257 [Bauhinia variegata]|uniref:Uncharacterized protein n=1 Tax=Bauhinia variegata TaxID=167791 RepID=A0ACB9LWV8_BAUVA|nr:hypothetical protein L6164_028257 [Bauhinia variegata]
MRSARAIKFGESTKLAGCGFCIVLRREEQVSERATSPTCSPIYTIVVVVVELPPPHHRSHIHLIGSNTHQHNYYTSLRTRFYCGRLQLHRSSYI